MSNHICPHDRFFRKLMANPKVIKEFVDNYLPGHIRKIIKPETIKLQNDSFIDDKLRMKITDLLYTAQFGDEEGYLYFLIEHVSTVKELTPFTVLKYKIGIMDNHCTTRKTKILPVVYSIILHSGRRNYNKSTNLFDLFGNQKALAEKIFYEPYQLIDLRTISDEKLKQHLWFGVMARIMKNIYQKDILPHFKSVVSELKKIEKDGDWDYIYTVLTYIFEAGEVKDQEDFVETIKSGLEIKEEKLMTLAETWRQQGFQQGETIGKEKALRKVVINLLNSGMPINKISQIVPVLTLAEINQIKAELDRTRY